MSHRTPCNYCTLRSIKKNVKHGHRLFQRTGHMGWITVYSVPVLIPIATFDMLTTEQREKFFVTSFMQLTNSCAC
jgi:hypothetical protein